MLHFLANPGASAEQDPQLSNAADRDAELLDAYSQTVSGVARQVSQAVAHLKVETNQPKDRRQPQAGTGSGFLISTDGYMVTNSHVVHGAKHMEASLPDGRRFTAELVGDDPATDLAVLKISGDHFATLAFGASDRLQVGQIAIAIGNPFGFQWGVPCGAKAAV
jgi:S1-C subfamily serine protease